MTMLYTNPCNNEVCYKGTALFKNLKPFLQSTLIKSKSSRPGFTLNDQQFEMKEANHLVKFNPPKMVSISSQKYQRNVSLGFFFSAMKAFVKGKYKTFMLSEDFGLLKLNYQTQLSQCMRFPTM